MLCHWLLANQGGKGTTGSRFKNGSNVQVNFQITNPLAIDGTSKVQNTKIRFLLYLMRVQTPLYDSADHNRD